MLVSYYTIIALWFAVVSCRGPGNNVCKNLKDYATIQSNKNCWYNPDVNSSPALIAKRYGYPFEKYKVTTKDGYILSLFRIPHGNKNITVDRTPVFLQHGIAVTSVIWMIQGKNSLAFHLADKGFDVWLGNARGSEYSTQHVNLTMEDPEYWNFSFHEMALYDTPSYLDFIGNATGKKGQIIWIGHSMGTSISYIYSSMLTNHANANLKKIISLAPIAYMKNLRSSAKLIVPFYPLLENTLKSFGVYALGQNPEFRRRIINLACVLHPGIIPCEIFLATFTGLTVEQTAPELIPVYLSYYPSGTSLKTIIHFLQIIANGGRFQQYDYGKEKNLQIYKTEIPPEYDVDKIKIPIHLLAASHDFLSEVEDVEYLYKRLRTKKSMKLMEVNNMYHFAHNDYLIGRKVDFFYKYLVDLLQTD